jgi:hypothetical protein
VDERGCGASWPKPVKTDFCRFLLLPLSLSSPLLTSLPEIDGFRKLAVLSNPL